MSATQDDPLQAWTTELARELGVSLDIDTRLLLDIDVSMLLDVARDAAHGVARPAAPVTTFLVGLAAGLSGGSPEAVQSTALTAQRLALGWASRESE